MSTEYWQCETRFPVKYLEPLGFRSLFTIGSDAWKVDLDTFLDEYIDLDSPGEHELSIEAGVVVIVAFEARYGKLEKMEGWLESSEVPFDARGHQYFEYEGEDRYFRPGMSEVLEVPDSECSIGLREALEIIEQNDDRDTIRQEFRNLLRATEPPSPLTDWV